MAPVRLSLRRPAPVSHALCAAALSLLLHAAVLLALAWSFRIPPAPAPATLEIALFAAPVHEHDRDAATPDREASSPDRHATSTVDSPGVPHAGSAARADDSQPRDAAQRGNSASERRVVTSTAPRDVVVAPSASARDTAPPSNADVAAFPADGAAPAPGMDAAALHALEWDVQRWLARHRVYPRVAARAGYEGTAWVRFVLTRDGALRRAELLRGSGHDTLDRAALALLQRAAPFPPLPPAAGVDEIELTLPVDYRLHEGDRG